MARTLDYRQLRRVTTRLAGRLEGVTRVLVWAEPTLETCVAVVGALAAGVPVVPVNPKSGEHELGHTVSDSAPRLVLASPGTELPEALQTLPRLASILTPMMRRFRPSPDPIRRPW